MAYKLTPLGERRVLNLSKRLNAESSVLNFLYLMRDPVEIEEIAGETHLTEEAAIKVVNRLMSAKYVKEI